jgi:alpha-amylase/alpha-mannosidase (GH57 family)
MKPLNIAIVWTYNQPYLKDRQGNFVLPSIRQYLQRDYIDMIKIAQKYKDLKLTFNITPFLFEQAADYVYSEAQDYTWLLSKKATAALSLQEKEFILRHFFKGDDSVIIRPYPRYAELYARKVRSIQSAENLASAFSDAEIRDLQVWHNLAWIGTESQKDKFVMKLIKKGRNFTEKDKDELLLYIRGLHQSMFDLYYSSFQSNNIELSTTAFYNPILPLALDNHSAKSSDSESYLPMRRFAAADLMMEQILQARKFNKKIFEQTSFGIQSPEAAIDKKTLDLYAKARFEWTVLEKHHIALSMKDEEMLFPYEYSSNNQHFINCFVNFSDLTERFSTSYPKMKAKDAVDDFISQLERLQEIAEKTHQDREGIVVLSLSGDTLWDLYEQSGTEFLHLLYSALEKHKKLQSSTPSNYLKNHPTKAMINTIIEESPSIDYSPWIGSAAANRAWDKLSETYSFYTKIEDEGELSEESLREAKLCIQKALNANWFKWYSNKESQWDSYYDDLFRSLLIECYERLYEKPPKSLFYNLKHANEDLKPIEALSKLIYPEIDGENTSSDEWQGAAVFDINQFQLDAGNPLYNYLASISIGYNESHICFHISFHQYPKILSYFQIEFHEPSYCLYNFYPLQGTKECKREVFNEETRKSKWKKVKTEAEFEIESVWECLIPIKELDLQEGGTFTIQFLLGEKEKTVERFPQSSTITLTYNLNL